MQVQRLAAFTPEGGDITGGNPAGVVLLDALPDEATMVRVAAEVGYSETAFVSPTGERSFRVRYATPTSMVEFCGHATVALGAALARTLGPGRLELATDAGQVVVDAELDPAGGGRATLTSVPPRHREPTGDELDTALLLLGWRPAELDPALPPVVAYAGAWHLVLAARTRERLARLEFDEVELAALMQAAGWTTLQLVWREDATTFHARDPAPGIGIPEDPATGAAAAALGGWLRDAGHLRPPTDLVVHQGVDLGRPSRLDVHVPAVGGIRVTGRVLPLAEPLEVDA